VVEQFGSGEDGQQIRFGDVAPPILRPTRLAVNVPVLDAADKPQLLRDARGTVAPGAPLRSS
jgi:hypothetical protein